MGIKNLNKLLKETCTNYNFSIHPKKLEGSTITIDTSYFLYSRYKVALAHVADVYDVDDREIINFILKNNNDMCKVCYSKRNIIPIIFNLEEVKRHWYNLINLYVQRCKKYGINLIWVLDGVSPVAKKDEHIKRNKFRSEQKDKAHKSIKHLINTLIVYVINEEHYELTKNIKDMIINTRDKLVFSIFPTRFDFDDMIEYLGNIGQTLYQAESEGETTCAKLVLDGRANYPFTKDTDVLLYGCPKVITKMSFAKNKEVIEYIVLKTVLKELKIDLIQFIDLCILMGCDYNSGIDDIGYKTAIDIIRRYGSLLNAADNVKDGKLTVTWGNREKQVLFDISSLNIAECYSQFILPTEKITKPVKGIPTDDISKFNIVPVDISVITSIFYQ